MSEKDLMSGEQFPGTHNCDTIVTYSEVWNSFYNFIQMIDACIVFYFIIILEYDNYADLLVDTDFQTELKFSEEKEVSQKNSFTKHFIGLF